MPLDQHILMRTRLVDLFDSSGLTAANRVNPELEQLARQGGRSMGSRQHRDVGRYHSRGGRPDGGADGAAGARPAARGQEPAAGDLLHLQPGRLRQRRHRGAPRGRAAHHERRGGGDPRDRRGALPHPARRGPCGARLLGLAERARARRRRPPRRPAARRSRRSSRTSSSASCSRSCSPPRRSRSASTCRRARSCSSSWRSSTARPACRSRRGSTPSSPAAPAAAASTSRATRSSSGSNGMDPQAVASLASRRTYPLNSSFTPTYNMAVNLIEQFGRERTREILESSFAQFQADRAVVDLARQVRSQEETLAGYAKSMDCHLGDFAEYSRIRRELTDLERKGAAQGAQASRADRDKRQRQLADLRKRMRQHPCHACPDRELHSRWAERWWRMKRETDQLVAQIKGRTGAVARTFDRVTEVLVELGYLSSRPSGELTLEPARPHAAAHLRRARPAGRRVAAARLLERPGRTRPRRHGHHAGVRAAPRGGRLGRVHAAAKARSERHSRRRPSLWATLDDLEREHHLHRQRAARHRPRAADVPLGVRVAARPGARGRGPGGRATSCAGPSRRSTCSTSSRIVADGPVGRTARRAIDGVLRGVVAYSSVL